jgi:hypothetical protein
MSLSCSSLGVILYQKQISGPLMDQINIHVYPSQIHKYYALDDSLLGADENSDAPTAVDRPGVSPVAEVYQDNCKFCGIRINYTSAIGRSAAVLS